jgi:hypothetical protein
MEYANKHLNLDATAAISKYKPESPKNRSSEPPRIQHEIYSGSDWLGGFAENLSASRKSGREGCEAPEPHLPLHPPMSCDLLYPKWEAINKELNFASLPSAQYVRSHKSLAPCHRALQERCTFISCSHQLTILLDLASHLSDLFNQQNHRSAPRFVSHTIHITFRNLGTVLSATRNPVI